MLGKKKSKQTPSWRAMLGLRPMRNPELEWAQVDGKVVLDLKHQKGKTWKQWVAGLILPTPPDRKVELDTIGSEVWLLIDGKNTLGSISSKLAKKYQLSPREAEMSLQQYCKELGRRGYVGFVGKDSKDQKLKEKS
ncbi:MAG: PqqD family protein [Abditibacteriaceae bacterium]